jgi:deoxyadenosine/deoxycytidine kinase
MFNFNTYLNIPIYLFTIEGNIGAGKTTVMNNLKEKIGNYVYPNTNIYYIEEPVEYWTKEYNEKIEGKTNHLKLQYNNPERFFFSFQVRVLLSYFKSFKRLLKNIKKEFKENKTNCCEKIIIIADRSPFSMKKVFFDGLCKKYNIRKCEIDIYNEMYNYYFKHFFTNYNVIYVNTHATQCYENKNKRCRSGEEIINIEFLNLLDLWTSMYILECKEKNINVLYYSYINNEFDNIELFINNLTDNTNNLLENISDNN